MNKSVKATAPITWPGPRAGRPADGGQTAPPLPAARTPGLCAGGVGRAAMNAMPCVPPSGCRGDALRAVPPAKGRPTIAGQAEVVSQLTSLMSPSVSTAVSPAVSSYHGSVSIIASGTPSMAGKGTKDAIMKAIVPLRPSSATSLDPPSSSSAAVRPRKDMAIVHNYTRGDKRKALAAAADDDLMTHAMSN